MKKCLGIAILCGLLLALPLWAQADDAGVLTEDELNQCIQAVLEKSAAEQPQNAPVGEEALTEDGYAFLYSFATLYYDKPVLDSQSVLKGFAFVEAGMKGPRGIGLGDSGDRLIETYGWENPYLFGDGTFVAFYQLDQLPQSAYWSWARCQGILPVEVRCAIHVKAGEDRYTDAGILYQLENDVITGIQVYGLSSSITQAEVESNLQTVAAVQTAFTGDESGESAAPVEGYTTVSQATAFGLGDLKIAKADFLTLTEAGAETLFGQAQSEDWVQDDTGEWLHTTYREGLTLTYKLDAAKQAGQLETLSITGEGLEGPRGLRIGQTLESVLALFRSDGTGQVLDREALLYGDGLNPPYGALAQMGTDATLRYVAQVNGPDGSARPVTLHMTFAAGKLTEIMVYSW